MFISNNRHTKRSIVLLAFSLMPIALAATAYSPTEVEFYDWDIVRYYYYFFIVRFSDYPFVVKMAFTIVLLSGMGITVIITAWAIKLIKRRKERRYKKRILKNCDEDLTRILLTKEKIATENVEVIIQRVEDKDKTLSRWKAAVWVDYLLDLKSKDPASSSDHQYTNIQTGNVIRQIFTILNLDSYIEYVVHFKGINKRIYILNAAKLLQIEIPESLLSQMLNHKHQNLRKEARLSFMHSSTHNTYRYLEEGRNIKYTPAIGIELHELFKQHKLQNLEMPAFNAMIEKQSDKMMKAFLILENAYWGSFDKDSIISLINSPYPECRYAAIVATGILKNKELENALVNAYKNQSEYIKCEILKALYKIKSGLRVGFFLLAYEHALSDMSRETALACLWNYNADSKELFAQLEECATEEEMKILQHVKHPLIEKDFDLEYSFDHERIA